MSEKELEGELALVTGGSRGIGRSICLSLAKAGATVAVNYVSNETKAQEVVEEIKNSGGQGFTVGFDVGDEAAVEAGIKHVVEQGAPISVLVNNAGISRDGLLVRTKTSDWEHTLRTNLSGYFYCSRAVAKPMMKAKKGRIISISSIVGEMGSAGQVAYSSAKAGIFGLTKSLARELGSRNITVNAVAPGYIETDMTANADGNVLETLTDSIPLGRIGQGEDVAELVRFLASPRASYITGQVVGINGGLYM